MPPVVKTPNQATEAKKRKYNGPPKGSEEAKAKMERVRAAQWAKNGLTMQQQYSQPTAYQG